MKTINSNQFETANKYNLMQNWNIIILIFIIFTSFKLPAQLKSENEKNHQRPRNMSIALNYSIDYRAQNAMRVYLNYHLTDTQLKLGPELINANDFNFDISENQLITFWPKKLFNDTHLKIITKDGNILFSGAAVNKLHLANNIKKLNQKIIQFCFSEANQSNSNHQYCSGYYKVDQNKLKKNKKIQQAFAEMNKEKIESIGKKEIQIGQKVAFKVVFEDGSIYQWDDSPQMIWIYDIQQSDTNFIIEGAKPFPIEPHEIIQREKESQFTQLIGFEKTIKDDRQFWRSQINEQNPTLHIRHANGGVFQYEFNLDVIPSNKNKLFLDEDTPQVTYLDKAFFKGFKPKNLKLNPIKGRIKEAKNDPLFIWEAATLKKHDINRAELEIYDGEQKYLGFYEVYRGVPTELSYRVSSIIDSKGFVLTSEIALNHWFEKIFDSQNATWSKLRWGLSLKHFQTLTPIKVALSDGSIDPMNMSAINFDIKYRLTPGIWDRDETHGVTLSYQNTTFGPTHAPIAGIGWFWARSMPRVFDDLLNYLPYMNHDKWVDMEFIYFPYSLSNDITLTSNYNLNFHGKVMWTESIFGEAGFGLKKYGLQDHPNNKLQDLYSIYGTIGLGINF